jgi:hypothetical protein
MMICMKAGSQLGAEALKSWHELCILGLNVCPCIVMLDNVASAVFLNSNTLVCRTLF